VIHQEGHIIHVEKRKKAKSTYVDYRGEELGNVEVNIVASNARLGAKQDEETCGKGK
jgi:hypothetical protein